MITLTSQANFIQLNWVPQILAESRRLYQTFAAVTAAISLFPNYRLTFIRKKKTKYHPVKNSVLLQSTKFVIFFLKNSCALHFAEYSIFLNSKIKRASKLLLFYGTLEKHWWSAVLLLPSNSFYLKSSLNAFISFELI